MSVAIWIPVFRNVTRLLSAIHAQRHLVAHAVQEVARKRFRHNQVRVRFAKCHRYGRYICVKFLKIWGKILESNIFSSEIK